MYKFVFVDIDGVLRDFVAKMKEIFLRDFPGHKIIREDDYDLRLWTSKGRDIFPWVLDGPAAETIFTQALPHSESLQAFQGWLAQMDGHFPRFAIVTHQKGDRILWTRKWLSDYGVYGKIPVYYTVEKTQVMLAVLQMYSSKYGMPILPSQCAFLDDSPKELTEAAAAGFNTVCIDQSWNQMLRCPRIKTLAEFDPFTFIK